MDQQEAWRLLNEFVERFDTKTAALAELNSILMTRYDIKRLGQWRRGEQSIPQLVIGFLTGVSELLKD